MLRDGIAAPTAAAGEAAMEAARWWDAVNADRLEEAIDISSSIVVPPLSNTFSFEEDDEGDGGGVEMGELGGEFEVIGVSPGTPQSALDYWNKEKLV